MNFTTRLKVIQVKPRLVSYRYGDMVQVGHPAPMPSRLFFHFIAAVAYVDIRRFNTRTFSSEVNYSKMLSSTKQINTCFMTKFPMFGGTRGTQLPPSNRHGMDAFVSSARPKPTLLFESTEIKDRDSVFVAAIYPAATPEEAKNAIRHHRNIVHGPKKAAHEIAAWRYMALKSGKSGIDGPGDFEVKGNYDDDGEKYGGSRILKVMQNRGIIDAVVIVSRWFGGTLLGPIRFTHIENSASEVCTKFKNKELIQEYIQQLNELDEEVATLRRQLGSKDAASGTPESPSKPNKYDQLLQSLDVDKAKRLVAARGKAAAALRRIQDTSAVTEPTGLS